jgi:hypothetical protein
LHNTLARRSLASSLSLPAFPVSLLPLRFRLSESLILTRLSRRRKRLRDVGRRVAQLHWLAFSRTRLAQPSRSCAMARPTIGLATDRPSSERLALVPPIRARMPGADRVAVQAEDGQLIGIADESDQARRTRT